MNSRQTDRVVKRGSFLYDGQVRSCVEIIRTDFRPGSGDYEDPEEDAYGEFYEVRYSSPGSEDFCAGGGRHDSLAEAVQAVESLARDVQWQD